MGLEAPCPAVELGAAREVDRLMAQDRPGSPLREEAVAARAPRLRARRAVAITYAEAVSILPARRQRKTPTVTSSRTTKLQRGCGHSTEVIVPQLDKC